MTTEYMKTKKDRKYNYGKTSLLPLPLKHKFRNTCGAMFYITSLHMKLTNCRWPVTTFPILL